MKVIDQESATFAAVFGRHERRYVSGDVGVEQASQGPRLTLTIPYNRESAPLSSRALGKFREVVRPSAFTRSLQERRASVVSLWNHEPCWVLGRLSNGTMEARSTPEGLVARVQLDGEDPMHLGFARRVARRDVVGASFGFSAIRAPVTRRSDGTLLRALEDVELEDVSPVTFPAYPDSEAEARALSLLYALQGRSVPDRLQRLRLRELDRVTARHGLTSPEARRRLFSHAGRSGEAFPPGPAACEPFFPAIGAAGTIRWHPRPIARLRETSRGIVACSRAISPDRAASCAERPVKGRRPAPQEVRLLRGTFRKDRVNREAPQPPVEVPRCPRWLDQLGRAAWNELAPILAEARVLTTADARGLAQLCDAIAVYRTARAVLARDGLTFTVRTESGDVVRPRPEVAIAQAADRAIRTWSDSFGLTPAGRPRVHVVPPKRDEENPFARLDREAKRRRFFGRRA